MRNALLTITIFFCLAAVSTAADQKKSPRAQPEQTQQTQVARNDTDGSMDDASSAKSDCMPKAEKQSKPKNTQPDPEGDPQASQNQIEYGGGG